MKKKRKKGVNRLIACLVKLKSDSSGDSTQRQIAAGIGGKTCNSHPKGSFQNFLSLCLKGVSF